MKNLDDYETYLSVDHKPPLLQVAIGAAITVVMTAVFYGFLFGTQS